jgi:hypothetical protein
VHGPAEPHARASTILCYEFDARGFHGGPHFVDAAEARVVPRFKSIDSVNTHVSCSSQIGYGPIKGRASHPTLDWVHPSKLPPKNLLTQKEIYNTLLMMKTIL